MSSGGFATVTGTASSVRAWRSRWKRHVFKRLGGTKSRDALAAARFQAALFDEPIAEADDGLDLLPG